MSSASAILDTEIHFITVLDVDSGRNLYLSTSDRDEVEAYLETNEGVIRVSIPKSDMTVFDNKVKLDNPIFYYLLIAETGSNTKGRFQAIL